MPKTQQPLWYLLSRYVSIVKAITQKHFVEDATDNIFTLSVPDLKSLYDNQKADGFHVQSFPAGHRQTCFSKWFQVSTTQDEVADNLKSYRVHYEEGFEPYVIAYRKFVPP